MDRPVLHRARHTNTQPTSRSIRPNNTHSERVCLYQNSSTLQISHRVRKNLDAVKETQNNEVELQIKQIRIKKYTTPLGVANGKCETLRDDEISVFLCEPETF